MISRRLELIRPLYLIREDDIKAWRDYNGLHFIQCACKFTDTCTTCNNEENRSKRVEIKQRHLDVAVFTLHAVLLLMANLRDARFYGVSFNEQFVCRVEIAA